MYTLDTKLSAIPVASRESKMKFDTYFTMIGGDGGGYRVGPENTFIYANALEDNFKWVLGLVEVHYYASYKNWKNKDKLDKALKIVQSIWRERTCGEVKTLRQFIELVNAIINNI